MPLDLRGWQADATEELAKGLVAKPYGRFLAVAATGAGKTVFSVGAVERVRRFLPGARTLFVVHSEKLLDQAVAAFRTWLPEVSVGEWQGTRADIDRDVVVAMIQTMAHPKHAHVLDDIQNGSVSTPFRFIFVDEGHHFTLDNSYGKTLLPRAERAAMCLLTATPERADGESLLDIAKDGVVCNYAIKDAIRDGHCVPPTFRRVGPALNFTAEDFNRRGEVKPEAYEKEFKRAKSAAESAPHFAKAILEGRRKGLIFTETIGVAQEMAKELCALGIEARCVWGTQGEAEREKNLEDHKNGVFPIICNAQYLLEGYDDTEVDLVGIAVAIVKSRSRYKQLAGRGARACKHRPEKRDFLVIDCVGAENAHGFLTAEVLLEDEDAGPRVADAPPAPAAEDAEREGYDEAKRLKNFLAYMRGERELESTSLAIPVRWLVASEGKCWVLAAGRRDTVQVELARDRTYNVVHEGDKKNPPLLLGNYADMRDAMACGEEWARRHGDLRQARKDWAGRARPADTRVLDTLRKMHISVEEGRTLTHGEAVDLIKMRWGAINSANRWKRPAQPLVTEIQDWSA